MGASGPDRPHFYGLRLLVKDFDRSWRFYRDVIGLTPLPGHGKPPYGEFVEKNRSIVSLFDRKLMARALGFTPARYAATALGASAVIFEVKDVDAVARRLTRRKVRFLRGPTDQPAWGLRTIHLRDPDGNLVELYSPLRTH
jgi:lactoylglutathione lyase